MHICVESGGNLSAKDSNNLSDPFVELYLDSEKLAQTVVKPATLSPYWNQHFEIYWYEGLRPSYLILKVLDKDNLKTDYMGEIMISVTSAEAQRAHAHYRVGRAPGRKGLVSGTILLNISIRNPLGVPEKVHRLLQGFCSTQGYNVPILTDKPPHAMQAALEAKSRLQESSATHIPSSNSEPPASSGADSGSAPISPVDVEADVASLSDNGEPAAEAVHDDASQNEVAHDQVEASGAGIPPPAEDDPTQPYLWSLPDSREQVELCYNNVIISLGFRRALGAVFLTNYRLVLVCDADIVREMQAFRDVTSPWLSAEDQENIRLKTQQDLSMSIPLGLLGSVSIDTSSKASYLTTTLTGASLEANIPGPASDDAWLLVPDETGSAHGQAQAQPSQEQAADATPSTKSKGRRKGISTVATLTVRCKDVRSPCIAFLSQASSGYSGALDAARLLAHRLDFLIYNRSLSNAAWHYKCAGRRRDWQRFTMEGEMARQGMIQDDNPAGGFLAKWVVCDLNSAYELSATYPSKFFTPRIVNADTIKGSAAFRSKGRLPALTWYANREDGIRSIVRCAQPKVGATSRRSKEDEELVSALRTCSSNSSHLVIFDARSSLAAGGNKLMGKGSEDPSHYDDSRIYYMEIANIHGMRQSHDSLLELCERSNDKTWFSALESTGWLGHIRGLLSAARVIARKVDRLGVTCMVHCSDGWDRTTQLCALAQIMLDPYFRTIDGLIVLIEKDWLAFGHKFKDRNEGPQESHERSPVFLQFLDCIWQMHRQLPAAFEFNGKLLIAIADHSQSGWFGNFFYNSQQRRLQSNVAARTTSLWSHVGALREVYTNVAYDAKAHVSSVLYPECSMKRLALWDDYYLRYDSLHGSDFHDADDEEAHGNTVVWVDDEHAEACRDCHLKFTLLRRRHHCRACGHVFCQNCSSRRVELPQLGYSTPQRTCEACYDRFRKQTQKKQYQDLFLPFS